MSKVLTKKLQKIADINEKTKEKTETKFMKQEWAEIDGLPNPFEVVKDFIKEKGLKL